MRILSDLLCGVLANFAPAPERGDGEIAIAKIVKTELCALGLLIRSYCFWWLIKSYFYQLPCGFG